MDNKNRNLFSPVNKHDVHFVNAIVMAPMTRSRAIGSVPNDLMAKYYEQRTAAGLIITEGNAPSQNGLGYSRTPGIFTKEQIEGWKKVTQVVHEKGGKIFTQLMHVGRVAHSANTPEGARILAPSAIAANGEIWTDSLGMQKKGTPETMTLADIKNTIDEFAVSARNAIEAGFDGVELHGANGYLPEQFLNPHVNQRNDEYGGSPENRSRFLLEVTQAMAQAIGKDKVGVRISPYSEYNDMPLYDEVFDTYAFLSNELAKLDIVYLHVVDGSARKSEEGVELISVIRQSFHNILILNGGYTKERAEYALQNDGADMISFGSSFLANPDLPYRLKKGIALNAPDFNTFFTPGEAGYTDYSFAQHEEVVHG